MQARILEEALSGNVGLRDGALANKICMAGKEGSKDNHRFYGAEGWHCMCYADQQEMVS
jgi:hypothetical protein